MAELQKLQQKYDALKNDFQHLVKNTSSIVDNMTQYTASTNAARGHSKFRKMPDNGMASRHCATEISDRSGLDFNPCLNTSSYVNVVFEPEEYEVAKLGLSVNLADQTVYPQSFKMHNDCINMVAQLWHCPKTAEVEEAGVFAGAGTVGSTEACLLAGLALKFRWREWYCKKFNVSQEDVLGIRPNMVISNMYQAAWEKFFKYMDVEPRFVAIDYETHGFCIDPKKLDHHIDEKTIACVGIMGNHYSGHYDPIHLMDKEISRINRERGFQVGIHVDGASGGFVAPFQKDCPAWDFRLPNVLSISASGHKFGVSCCGTGWVIFREKKGLSEHVAISVSYLGGHGDSYTLNFSRPATGVYVQLYQFLRLGISGYTKQMEHQLHCCNILRNHLAKMKHNGKPRFQIMDDAPNGKVCLPVVAARLNPDQNFTYDDIDLQHVIAEHQWYVSGYGLNFNHPITEKKLRLFTDISSKCTMFRVVVKANINDEMIFNLVDAIENSLEFLDNMEGTYVSSHVVANRKNIVNKVSSPIKNGIANGDSSSRSRSRSPRASPLRRMNSNDLHSAMKKSAPGTHKATC